MKSILSAMAAAVAMGLCAPAMAQGYNPKGGTVDQQIAKNCGGKKGDQRANCETRIRNSYREYLNRNGAADSARDDRQRGQANQRVNAQAGRILDAQRNAQPR